MLQVSMLAYRLLSSNSLSNNTDCCLVATVLVDALMCDYSAWLTRVHVPSWFGNDQRATHHKGREGLEHVGIKADGVAANTWE